MTRSRWSSLRRLTLERFAPGRRAWSGEELRVTESEARLLPVPRGDRSRPFLPRYQSTGSCCLCPQTTELWKKGFNQSAPSVFSPASRAGKSGRGRRPINHQSLHHPSTRARTNQKCESSAASSSAAHPPFVFQLTHMI